VKWTVWIGTRVESILIFHLSIFGDVEYLIKRGICEVISKCEIDGTDFLLKNVIIGFTNSFVNSNIYIKVVDGEHVIILLYVYDLLLIGVEV